MGSWTVKSIERWVVMGENYRKLTRNGQVDGEKYRKFARNGQLDGEKYRLPPPVALH